MSCDHGEAGKEIQSAQHNQQPTASRFDDNGAATRRNILAHVYYSLSYAPPRSDQAQYTLIDPTHPSQPVFERGHLVCVRNRDELIFADLLSSTGRDTGFAALQNSNSARNIHFEDALAVRACLNALA